MGIYGVSRSSLTINSIWKVRGRRPTLRRTCKVFIPRDLRELGTLRLPATYEEDHFLVHKLKALTKRKLHHWILIAAISLYLYAGALLFQYLNSQCQEVNTLNVTEKRETLVNYLYNLSNNNTEISDWLENVREAVRIHEITVIQYNDAGYGPDIATREHKGLSIESAVFFCFTVITTIGYGNIVPCTNMSRGVTTIYACLGVPLMILVLADLGKLFTRGMKFIFFHSKRFYKTGTFNLKKESVITENKQLQYMTVSWRTVSQERMPEERKNINYEKKQAFPIFQNNQVTTLTIHNDDLYKNLDFQNPDEKNHKHIEVKDDFYLPVSIAIFLVLVYMIVGGFLFSLWEKWSFFEGFYFVFISMTTIGFGDYVPKHEEYMLGAFAYLVLGLMLTSMCINVIGEKLTVTFQKARVKIGNNTVLNVSALLEDEDHRSRAPQIDPFHPHKYNTCFGFKMTIHRDSLSPVSNTVSQQTLKANSNVLNESLKEESKDEFKHEALLRVPSRNRFTFYDSPYNTIQDENEGSGHSQINTDKEESEGKNEYFYLVEQ
ncbi:potassium channel subfamily K member 2-like [Argiope bruennichi]|uniref:potassium channel subfamily K member 2-like n=1 Tax=Argiope bruennichi TaxID=94029 RepID=UPI0024948D1F|nr:potassium channel subfamily K member 2-like [Argiope bruennichi]